MISNQAYLFSIFTIDGFIISILFDIFRILRRVFKTRDFITYIEDFIFWLLAGTVLLYTIFKFNNGEIRLYFFIAVSLGIFFYMSFLSTYVVKIAVCILNFFKSIFTKIIFFILVPIKKIYLIIRKICFKPISFFTINIREISTILFKNRLNILFKNKKLSKNKRIL